MKIVDCILLYSDIYKYISTMQYLNGLSMIYLASRLNFVLILLCLHSSLYLTAHLTHKCCCYFGFSLPHNIYTLSHYLDFL